MCDRICTKVFTTDNAVMLPSEESATEQQTTKSGAIGGLQLRARQGHTTQTS